MLDISIKNLDTISNSDKVKSELFELENVKIFEKYDGIKISLIRNEKPYSINYNDNWIIAYKGSILYKDDFAGCSSKRCNYSYGMSQFKKIHEMLANSNHLLEEIPQKTEFLLEFIMKKPTLTRDYVKYHDIFLICYSKLKSNPVDLFGKVNTNPVKVLYEHREEYSKKFQIKTPRLICSGKLSSKYTSFDIMKYSLLQGTTSELGNKMEGIIIETPEKLFKLVQPDQYDKDLRLKKKNKFRMEPEKERIYWEQINKQSERILKNDPYMLLKFLSCFVYGSTLIPYHSKKNYITIHDDLYLTTKTKILKRMHGNNGALLIGRFQPPTKAHTEMANIINQTDFDYIIINIVNAGDKTDKSPYSVDLIKEMWKTIYPDIEIQVSKTGNLRTILNKCNRNINAVICGDDRQETYKKQLEGSDIETKLVNYGKTRASKVRTALFEDDYKTFTQYMDKKLWKFYPQLKENV